MQWVAAFFGACVVGVAVIFWLDLRNRGDQADE